MTDQEVIFAVRRHMLGIEHSLLADPPVTAEQWTWAMTEYTKEMVAAFGAAPVVVDAPAVLVGGTVATTATVGDSLSCTKGNWRGEPNAYVFQWRRDDANIGTASGSDAYVLVDADIGHSIACVVSASNSRGSTTAPPSNAVMAATAATAATATAARAVPRSPTKP